MPLVQVVLFGFALRSDVRDIRLAVVDPAPDHATMELRTRFEGTGRFRVVAVSKTPDAIEPLFRRGSADVALVFESGFAGKLESTEPAHLLVAIDASDPNTGTTYLTYTRAVISSYQSELNAARKQVRIASRWRIASMKWLRDKTSPARSRHPVVSGD